MVRSTLTPFLILTFLGAFETASEQNESQFTSPVLIRNKPSNILTFAGKSYYFNTVFRGNFYKATQFCRQQGMQLVSILSKAENDRIGKFISDNYLTRYHFWTSATNLGGDNEWIWLSTGHNIQYFNWYTGEPSGKSMNNYTENCIEVRHWGSEGFTWNDIDCSSNLYFICEPTGDCAK